MTTAHVGVVLRHLRRLAGPRLASRMPDGQLVERFAARRDEAAFATLVRRHGPMVLNVCRSVLRHEQDAEDAFQATFLVLARKAESIRQPEAVAGWLSEVAYHVAVRAQADAARRRAQERRACPMAAADPTLDMTLRDLRRVLHEELRGLPDKYRVPLVLCYLEGRSHEEAAGQLGWSKGTFRGRLDRGREQLRRRLAARGVALSALLCATAVAPRAAAEALVDSVVRAAVPSAAGGAAPVILPARVSALAEGVTRAMFTRKLSVITAALVAVGLVATGAGLLAHQALAARTQALASESSQARGEKPGPADAPPPADEGDSVTYGGRVLGPDDKPVAGARLYLKYAYANRRSVPTAASATTGADGRFRFTAPKAKEPDEPAVVLAVAADRGAGWLDVPAVGRKDNLTLRLVTDDVPIAGQVVDLQGKPIPDVTVRVLEIKAAPGEDLGAWVAAAESKKGLSLRLEQEYLSRSTDALALQATTDAGGRFRLTGLGRNRLVIAQLDGPTVASQHLYVLTRPGKAIDVTEHAGHPEDGDPGTVIRYYGAEFRHVAAPSRPIVGVVRDRETKKPLAGVTVRSYKMANHPIHFMDGQDLVRTTTDAHGRYRLTGMPKGAGNKIIVAPPGDLPYLAVHAEVADDAGLDPVTVDFDLKRGVWIEGKVTDAATGKPVKVSVEYFAMRANPNVRDHPGFDGTFFHLVAGKEDGSYRVVGLPGPGLVGVYHHSDYYLRAPNREGEFGIKEKSLSTAPYHLFHPVNYGALARIDPPRDALTFRRDVTLDPGWTFTGRVVGPDGKPLTGVRGFGLSGPHWYERDRLRGAEFTVRGFDRPRDVLFMQPEKGLVGEARAPEKSGGSVTVRLETGAAVTGRLVGADGRPRADVELKVTFRPGKDSVWRGYFPERIRTDGEGRFRLEALLPDRKYRLADASKGELTFGEGLQSGRTRELGDVRLERAADPEQMTDE